MALTKETALPRANGHAVYANAVSNGHAVYASALSNGHAVYASALSNGHAVYAKNKNALPQIPRKARPQLLMIFVAGLVIYCTTTNLSQSCLPERSALKTKPNFSSSSFLQEIEGQHSGTEDTESESDSTQDMDVESASPSRSRKQRVFELPYAEQKGSWIGNQWVPPDGWRYFSAKDMRKLYKDKSLMIIGDSLARRAVTTMYGILNQAGDYSSDVNVPVPALDADGVINVNKEVVTEPCLKWMNSTHQPNWCRIMPGGDGDYVYLKKLFFRDLRDFIRDELSGKSNITENIDTIVIVMGNWDAKTPHNLKGILAEAKEAVNLLGKLQSKGKTIIWRSSGFRNIRGKSKPFFDGLNQGVVKEIDSITTRLQQENNTASNLTCIDWAGTIKARSFGDDRIRGNTGDHYGLEARLALLQMVTNHLASRQGLEF
jgi:hypothetical protein